MEEEKRRLVRWLRPDYQIPRFAKGVDKQAAKEEGAQVAAAQAIGEAQSAVIASQRLLLRLARKRNLNAGPRQIDPTGKSPESLSSPRHATLHGVVFDILISKGGHSAKSAVRSGL
jgi:hypothetical protein